MRSPIVRPAAIAAASVARTVLATANANNKTFTVLLGSVAAISLLVGASAS